MPDSVYSAYGIGVRNHRGAEPPRDPEPSGPVAEVGRGDRAPAPDAAADGVEASAGAARRRLRGIDSRRAAASLPAQSGASSGGRRVARSVSPVLVRARRCSRTLPRPLGSRPGNEKQETQEKEREMKAEVRKNGEKWTLIIVRELSHPPEKVWQALTDPAQLRQWAPFDVDRSLAAVGKVKLTWIGAPTPQEGTVKRADAPRVLEYDDTRWELEAVGSGTRLKLWSDIDRRFISWGAAGWHISFEVLGRRLAGEPAARIAGPAAMKSAEGRRLAGGYDGR